MNLTNKLLLNKEFSWQHLRALHQLRANGETRIKVHQNAYFQYLIEDGLLTRKRPSAPLTRRADALRFNQEYDRELAAVYEEAKQFLSTYELDTPQARFTLVEIIGLQKILTQCDVIVKGEMSRGRISSDYLGGAKVLKKSELLNKAVLRILSLNSYPELDSILDRALLISGCPRGRRIVLCENDAYLRQPDKAEALRTALWYAGGNNIAKLRHSPDPDLAFYYSCDWDHHGLLIYTRLRAMYAERGYHLQLLTPVPTAPRKPVTSIDHNSRWEAAEWTKGLATDPLFTPTQWQLLMNLIAADEWIEEESNELGDLLQANNILTEESDCL